MIYSKGFDYLKVLHEFNNNKVPLTDCPTQLTIIFMILYLYLSVVFHDKYQSSKYEKTQH